MARPTKNGLDYFSLDVHCCEKIDLLEAVHKIEGFGIYIKLLQVIYADGYAHKFDKNNILVFSKRNNVDINRVIAVINSAIEYNLFNKDAFDKYEILTSTGIQKRYSEAVARRKEVTIIKEHWILREYPEKAKKVVIVDINGVIVDNIINKCSQQSTNKTKLNKTKLKEIKIKENKEELLPKNKFLDYRDVIKLYLEICTSFPKVEKISDIRKRHIKARMTDNTIEEFKKCFSKAQSSEFLRENTFCDLWWLMKSQENFLKTLEGKYDKSDTPAKPNGDGIVSRTQYDKTKPKLQIKKPD
jgi:hypothetical protein